MVLVGGYHLRKTLDTHQQINALTTKGLFSSSYQV